MAKAKGQGAMEYMMTYGWAILVVLIIGLAIHRLGIFKIGSSTPTTYTGFNDMKPLVSTCVMKEGDTEIWLTGYRGMKCRFINTAGTTIYLKDISILNNGKKCYVTALDANWNYTSGQNLYYVCDGTGCTQYGGSIAIPSNGLFTIFDVSCSTCFTETLPTCYNFKRGEVHKFDINITYDVIIGGQTRTKVSIGKIQLTTE